VSVLAKKERTAEFLYVGTQKGLEADIIPKEGIPFETVDIEGLKRSFSPTNIVRLGRAMHGLAEAAAIVRRFRPDVVIGTGASTTRRGRDLIGAIGGVAVIGVALMPSLLNLVATRSHGLDGSGLMMIGRVLSLSPFGWAFAAPGFLAQGQLGMALVLTAGALMLPVVLMPLWGRVVRRVMSGDRATGRRGRRGRGGHRRREQHEKGNAQDQPFPE